ncbi:MAG: FMN-binding protein [Clostridiales bacterium]|nr:FMN-binding protein [Clostridiales bacterium]MCD8223422.1 FMN-binding protein [Clostridiales bacterium]
MTPKAIKNAIILFVITLIAGFCLGLVHEVTLEPIAAAQLASATATYQEVYPEAASFTTTEELEAKVAAAAEEISAQGYGNVTVDDIQEALDAGGNVLGYLISASSNDGYNGLVQVSVGITNEGTLTGIGFLSIGETPGLGMKAKEPAFKDQFNGKPADTMSVVKVTPTADNQIQAISGASYTSNATTNAVNAAVYFYNNCLAE